MTAWFLPHTSMHSMYRRQVPLVSLTGLADLERRINAVTGSGRSGRGSRPRNETGLPEAIAGVLSQAGGPMNVGDIAEKVQAGGYRSGSANFRAIVSDTDSPQINNLVIAQIPRGIQLKQDDNYKASAKTEAKKPTPAMVLIEEAHEFLSAERIRQMPVLFQQVARIAKHGRKRWLGLGFITQRPQHLPDEALGLINNWVLHKIGDANVIARLRKSSGGMDDELWGRMLSLAPGQAVVSLSGLVRPLQVAIDPTPCKLQMVD